MRNNDLRKLIYEMLNSVCNNVSYELALNEKMFPHIVFSYNNIDMSDFIRHDYILDIDIWDKSESAFQIEELADKIESLFNNCNSPQETILPTFYLIDRKTIPDEDKKIRHKLIRVQVQYYER